MHTESVLVESLEEGDTIIVDGQQMVVDDYYENGKMDGIWIRMTSGFHRFFPYDSKIELVVR